MINWSRKHTVIAGLALIAVTNLIALIGAAYNRSGEPESGLRLTERELSPPYRWRGTNENSGLALQLQWRVLDEGANHNKHYFSYPGYGGEPAWLDKAKLEELGFDMSIAPANKTAAKGQSLSNFDKQLPRDALLVLELDGATYQRSVRLVTEQAVTEIADAGPREIETTKTSAMKRVEQETHENSRLFVVDTGIDLAALRKKYPDVTRYAIAHGQVRVHRDGPTLADKLTGYVSGLDITTVNVPFDFRETLESIFNADASRETNKSRFMATVVFGRRLEPWIISVEKITGTGTE